MKLTVSKEILLKGLSNIQGIVEKKSTMPILSHFLLDCSGPSTVLYATDLETAVQVSLNVKPSVEGALAIPAKTFISMVKELDEELTLTQGENFTLDIHSGKVSMRLSCLDPKEFPAWPEINDAVEVTLNGELLRELIEKTVYAASDADTRYVFNGILLNTQGGQLTSVGTDGHRLALFRTPVEIDSEIKVILPKKAVTELKRLLGDDPVTLLIGKNHVLFRTGDLQFLTKVIEGTFPNYEQVIPRSSARRFVVLKAGFEKALKRVSIISRERSNAVRLDMAEGILKVSAFNPELGSAEEELAVEYSGDAFTIGFNARYILDALQAVESDYIVMEFNDPLGPSLLRGDGDEEYLVVIMPMRI